MRATALLALMLVASPAAAQTDDRDFLTAFLEDSLSDAGREVTITGFAGALSSRATIERLTIADAEGVWLTITGARLDWSRSALLSGALTISELSAEEIVVARLPEASESDLPSPEATPFRLPELPLSITLDQIAAERIVLGEPVLGQPVEGRLDAAATLAGGEGTARLDLVRTGAGPAGQVILDASYANATGRLQIDLVAEEGAGGIAVSLLGVPGAPAAVLTLQGDGPLDNHEARLRLETDGVERLAGTVVLSQADGSLRRLQANVAGNLAPLFLPDYAAFFGDRVALDIDARQTASGGIGLDRFTLQARALQLDGSARIAADGVPEFLDLTGTLASPDGGAVLLPLSGEPTRVGRADFALRLQQGEGPGWSASLQIEGLDHADLKAARLELDGSGRIGRTPAGRSLGGTLRAAATGLAWTDPALAEALGNALNGGLKFHLQERSGAVSLSNLRLAGAGLAVEGNLRIAGLAQAFQTTGQLTVTASDLGRFSGLAGRQLGGGGTIITSGSVGPLTGALDIEAGVEATGLRLGIAQIDRLLSGRSSARLSVLRDETGTTLRDFQIAAAALTGRASGKLATAGSTIAAELALTDLSALDPRYGGAVSLQASFDGTADTGDLALDGSARSLRLGSAEIDRLLTGESRLSARLALTDGTPRITAASLTNPQLDLTLSGTPTGLAIDGRLNNLGLLIPDLQGPLALSGTAADAQDGYVLNLTARGPGGIDARIAGPVASNAARADLRISGSSRAAPANLFIAPRAADGAVSYDLRLNGPIRLSSLSGRVTLSGGRISDPDLGQALQNVEAMAQLAGGAARLAATAELATGGRLRIDGPVDLAAPFGASLALALDRIRLVDPDLYDARVSGSLRIEGPLVGGAVIRGALSLGETELRVPSSGFATAAALLDLQHVNEPAAVRQTRERAGLLGQAATSRAGAGRPFALDLTVSAPSRIFLRGRGIDAELGGQVRLGGTTAALVPSGGFQLIRGRLDILGKRLVLSAADLQLEGSFVPMLRVVAQTESDGIVSTVTIEGPANDPQVVFASIPDRPQEEVLARLLFGRDLGNLSAFQAAQLANAVAVLAGRGGEGIVGRLRKGFGLDDFDLTTSDDGTAALTAGKYLSENLYSEIEIEQGGKSRVTLNLDLRDGVTVRGKLGEDGDTGLGIFIERDY
jgi:translocation and assembly module TamB